jgi:hypothetical protein
MITVTVTLPPAVDKRVVDSISVTVLDDTHDRQPRSTYLEGMHVREEAVILTFTT